MIFGKSNKQKIEDRYYTDAHRKIYGVREFAWKPTKLESGEFVWLQHYYKYYTGEYYAKTKKHKLQWVHGNSYMHRNFLDRDESHVRCYMRDPSCFDKDNPN